VTAEKLVHLGGSLVAEFLVTNIAASAGKYRSCAMFGYHDAGFDGDPQNVCKVLALRSGPIRDREISTSRVLVDWCKYATNPGIS
jgi:hypothetical protein